MTPLFYSRTAFKALAGLSGEAQAMVRETVDKLRMPTANAVAIRALPGGLEHDLAQVAVEGVGRLVCRISANRIDVLAIAQRNHGLPPAAKKQSLGPLALKGAA